MSSEDKKVEKMSHKERINLMITIENEMKERNLQRSILDIKKKYGKNAILKGMNFEDGGTTRERNEQVGGHKG